MFARKMLSNNVLTVWLSLLLLSSCSKYEAFNVPGADKNLGYVAYEVLPKNDLTQFSLTSPKALGITGKTLASGRFLYITEIKKGIQVYDNVNPKSPKSIAYLKIPAITDFLVEGNTLVAAAGDDLLSFNVLALQEIATKGTTPEVLATNPTYFGLVKRLEKVVEYPNFPEQRNVFFQCPDTLGYVLEWKLDSAVQGANCYR